MLSGLGAQFLHFGTILIDPGAAWTVSGTAGQLAGGTAITGFDADDRLRLTGVQETGLSYAGGVLSLTGPMTLDILLPGIADAAALVLTTDTGGSWITLTDPDAPTLGTEGPDSLAGNARHNVIDGLGGDDTIDGGAGFDTMAGHAGNDMYVVDDPHDLVVEAAGAGFDSVTASADYTLPDNVEALQLAGTARHGWGNALANTLRGNPMALSSFLSGGDGDDTLAGMNLGDSLAGDAGNDCLDGGAGADTLRGGTGDDIYLVDRPDDMVIEDADGGQDTVLSASPFFFLGDNTEALALQGTGNAIGWGNSRDNLITGNAGNNALRGGQGNDTLGGGAGRDTLTGGTGNDWLDGGDGDDTLDGGAGADTLRGGTGDDMYLVDRPDDMVIEDADGGQDTVLSASPFFFLGDNTEALALQGTGNAIGWGNSRDNLITGNAGNNALRGGQGNDTLDGGAGQDTLTGGTGRDLFIFHTGQAAGDMITDFRGAAVGGGDALGFTGFGTAGASFAQLSATDWQITAAGGAFSEVIRFADGAAITPADWHFS